MTHDIFLTMPKTSPAKTAESCGPVALKYSGAPGLGRQDETNDNNGKGRTTVSSVRWRTVMIKRQCRSPKVHMIGIATNQITDFWLPLKT